jgi:hypothetical protein
VSKLLFLTNRLKAEASERMLTPSQRLALAELEKRWQFPDRLNLCGPPGSGKTFLGWVMARHLQQTSFYASPRVFEQAQPPYPTDIVIDNAPSEEKEVRRLLSKLQLYQVHRTLLITSSPIRLGWPVIELFLPTAADIAVIHENCSRLQFHPSPSSPNETHSVSSAPNENDKETANYWHIIYSVL